MAPPWLAKNLRISSSSATKHIQTQCVSCVLHFGVSFVEFGREIGYLDSIQIS